MRVTHAETSPVIDLTDWNADHVIEGTEELIGPQGEPGEPGAAGDTGATGSAGPPGADGTAGPPGAKGDPGDVGATGPEGAVSTVPGPKGDLGDTGPQGIQGETGSQGPPGDSGILIQPPVGNVIRIGNTSTQILALQNKVDEILVALRAAGVIQS